VTAALLPALPRATLTCPHAPFTAGPQGKKLSEEDLPLAPLPGPAAPNVRDATPVRRQGSSGSDGALPQTPQTGASARAVMSPVATPRGAAAAAAAPGTPHGDATARSLAFSPAPGSKQPVPRFDGAERGGGTPTTPGTKRNALGLEIPRPSPRSARPPASDALLSPRGGGGGIRPSRLCFDSAADDAATAAAAGEDKAAPRGRRLSFDAPAGRGAAKADAAKAGAAPAVDSLQREASGSGAAPALTREGSGFSSGRSLSGGLQFELKASTMAVSLSGVPTLLPGEAPPIGSTRRELATLPRHLT
jgi:hypothetical protein